MEVGAILLQKSTGKYYLVYEVSEEKYRLHLVGVKVLGDKITMQYGILNKSSYNTERYTVVAQGYIKDYTLIMYGKSSRISRKYTLKYRV